MNPIARHLLYNHYCDYLDPLNEPEFAQRQDANPALPPVEVVRMLITGPGHQLMQAICTMGVSDVRLRRGRAKSPRHVEFMALVPAAWDLQDPEHWWVMDMHLTTQLRLSMAICTVSNLMLKCDPSEQNLLSIIFKGCFHAPLFDISQNFW